jgi:hypothetical protein
VPFRKAEGNNAMFSRRFIIEDRKTRNGKCANGRMHELKNEDINVREIIVECGAKWEKHLEITDGSRTLLQTLNRPTTLEEDEV